MIRIGAYMDLSNRPVADLPMVRDVVKDIFPERSTRPISVATIQREAERFFGVSHSATVNLSAEPSSNSSYDCTVP